MVYVNIPHVAENDKIDTSIVAKELEVIDIDEDARYEAFAAIYNRHPHGVSFDDPAKALLLEKVLSRLGIPFRQTEKNEYI